MIQLFPLPSHSTMTDELVLRSKGIEINSIRDFVVSQARLSVWFARLYSSYDGNLMFTRPQGAHSELLVSRDITVL